MMDDHQGEGSGLNLSLLYNCLALTSQVSFPRPERVVVFIPNKVPPHAWLCRCAILGLQETPPKE